MSLAEREVPVTGQDLFRPRDLVRDALAGRLSANPQFEILKAVVGLVAVLVMDALAGQQASPEVLGHDPAVLKKIVGNAAAKHLDEQGLAVTVDRSYADGDISGAGDVPAELLAESLVVPFQRRAFTASTVIPAALDELSQGAHGIDAPSETNVALDFETRQALTPVHFPPYGVAGNDRWMNNGRQIRWPSHVVQQPYTMKAG